MTLKKINVRNMFIISFLLLLISLKPASGALFFDRTGLPILIQLFLLINIPTQFLTIPILSEVARVSRSKVWNDIFIGLFFNILQTIALAILINFRYPIHNIYKSAVILVLYSIGVFAVIFSVYFLAVPIVKKINFLRSQYLPFYVLSVMTLYFAIKYIPYIQCPSYQRGTILFGFLFLYLLIIVYFPSVMFHISRKYLETGFVRIPFLVAGCGLVAILIFFILILATVQPNQEFYYILALFITSLFTLVYYLRYCVNYPSLIDPKWKALMPFDLPKVTIAMTLAFLAFSLYYAAKEHPNFIIYQNISYFFVVAFLLPLFLCILLILTYLRIMSSRTKLRYWEYLRYGLYIHVTVTSYVLSLIFLSWDEATNSTKILCAIFGVASFAFYLFFALDLRTVLSDQDIEPTFNKWDISRHIVSLYSWFFLLFFSISFTYGKTSEFIGVEFISYPVMLFLIVFFLIAFGSYLGVTHKGFEEIMKKGMWSELSYFAAFIAFLTVYLIYSSLGAAMQRFPYHNSFFLGYFAVLILEIAAMRALELDSRYKKVTKMDILSFLNSRAHSFLRTDYLEDLWEKVRSKYITDAKLANISFDSPKREFHLEEVDEKTRLAVAVEMLLRMPEIPDVERVMVQRESLEKTKEEIVQILKEKILLLPEELLSEFDECRYYPLLLERAMNDLLTHLETFIPEDEHKMIFERLKRRDELFNCISFEGEEIRIKDGTRFGRAAFLTLFKLYLEAVEEKFPFKRCLLRGLVKEEIKKELHPTIAVGDVINIVPTGLKEIDLVIAGGFVKGSITLLITEETEAKQKLLLSFIKKGLTEGMSVIYATSKRPFQQIVGELLVDAESIKNFVILDLYETLYTENRGDELIEEEQRVIVPLNKILFQRSVVKTIKSHQKDKPRIVIIDVYDDFSKYYSPEEIYEILQSQVEGLKRWNCTSLIVLDPQSYLMKRKGMDEVKKHFENILILSGGDKETTVVVEKLYHGTPFKPVIYVPW